MGTVGLSFGSPTSGEGFDVSSTVAAIVSNLQNVETPWKNQLTKLQNQDAAISTLGSLFSNLSNDISSLTDFQGILAEKTGSSSDTNVLELTAATSSATAGTHTVVVNSLAQTSSGYLAPITNGADTLSGSITLQAGNGTAQTIDMSSLSNQTLAGLAAAINSSGVGITASVLTDSSGSRLSLVSGSSGANGNITVSSNTIADATTSSGTLGYTSAVSGADASLTVDGVNLTSASNTVSNLIPGITFQLLGTSAAGSQVQVVIGNDNTGVESTINSFVSDYNALISAINTQEGNDTSGNPEPLFGSPTLSLLQQELLSGLNTQNPNGYLDPVSNAADALSGSITVQVGGGTAQTVNVGDSSTPDTLAGLAQAINTANLGVTANVVTNSTGSQLELLSNTAGAAGALQVTSSVTDTTTGSTLNYSNGGTDIGSLTALGISVNNDGSLTFDASSLDAVLNSDYNSVVGFFQNANSWGQSFSTMLTNAGTSSSTGILKLAQNSNSSMESTLNAEISREQSLISAQQTSLTAELSSANEILQQLPSQLQGVNELYAAITGYNQNTNG
jgi:flagellar hook-associated protein 2